MSAVPWQAKIVAKLLLSRLPVGHAAWRRVRLFVHGGMDDADYGEAVFHRHFARSGLRGRHGFTCLELGPGDGLAGAILAKAWGADHCWLVDTGDFASRDMAGYRDLARRLRAQGLVTPGDDALDTIDGLLAACGAHYLINGVAGLATVPAASVDFIWSQAVLEHVRRRDFDRLLREMRRVLRSDGVASHRIDLRDHLGGALNNLRFSDRVWESAFMAESGFYTNRLQAAEIVDRCRAAGFAAEIVASERWPSLPTPRRRLAAPFRNLPEETLLVSGFDLVLRPI
jgi:SAM-dependent methyltransferase